MCVEGSNGRPWETHLDEGELVRITQRVAHETGLGDLTHGRSGYYLGISALYDRFGREVLNYSDKNGRLFPCVPVKVGFCNGRKTAFYERLGEEVDVISFTPQGTMGFVGSY